MLLKYSDQSVGNFRKLSTYLWSQCSCEVDLEIAADKYWKLECVSLTKTLVMMVERYPEFHNKLLALWRSKPCTQSDPYSLLVYGDELVPGNVLAQDPRRKIFGCQACIKDFGPMFVKSNASWIPLFCVRHDIAQKVPGGMSYILRMYLRHLFLVEKSATEASWFLCGQRLEIMLCCTSSCQI